MLVDYHKADAEALMDVNVEQPSTTIPARVSAGSPSSIWREPRDHAVV